MLTVADPMEVAEVKDSRASAFPETSLLPLNDSSLVLARYTCSHHWTDIKKAWAIPLYIYNLSVIALLGGGRFPAVYDA